MIIKSFEIDKSNISKFKLFVVYGENEGLKKEIISKIKKNHVGKEIRYEEEQILKNKDAFFSEIKNKSLFEEKKILIVERCSEKISETVVEIEQNYLDDLITCVHIIQLKALTCIRVGQKQKKININIPNSEDFIHKIYINVARKIYANVYLFEYNVSTLQTQKNTREIELFIR